MSRRRFFTLPPARIFASRSSQMPRHTEAFRGFCKAGLLRGCGVGRYVLMPDHLHLFVRLSDPVTLSQWMKALKGTLSKLWRGEGKTSPLWQKGFFDHVVRSGEAYEKEWQYVFAIPVEAGLVMRATDWPYQGEMEYLSLQRRFPTVAR